MSRLVRARLRFGALLIEREAAREVHSAAHEAREEQEAGHILARGEPQHVYQAEDPRAVRVRTPGLIRDQT
jgi:hypothetical protein